MAINPVPIMVVFAVAYIIQAMVLVDDLNDPSETEANFTSAPDFEFSSCGSISGWDFVGDIVDCIQDALDSFIAFATFEPAGAPRWVGIPLSIILTGTVTVFVLQMIRGN